MCGSAHQPRAPVVHVLLLTNSNGIGKAVGKVAKGVVKAVGEVVLSSRHLPSSSDGRSMVGHEGYIDELKGLLREKAITMAEWRKEDAAGMRATGEKWQESVRLSVPVSLPMSSRWVLIRYHGV